MYRSRSKKLLLCFLVGLVGMTSCTFAIDFSKLLQQSSQSSDSMATLFEGKTQTSNIYNKALKLAKKNELGATQKAIDGIVKYYGKQSCAVSAKDVLYVLFDSNLPFQSFFTHVVLSETQDGGRVLPLPADVIKSYTHFFTCFKIQNPQVRDYDNLKAQIANVYYQSINGNFMIDTMTQVNYGEDLYRNGSKADSEFDLLIDINDIGNIFFTSFQSTPEMLFYRMPSASGGGGGGSNGGSNPNGTSPNTNPGGGTGGGNGGTQTGGGTFSKLPAGSPPISTYNAPAALGTEEQQIPKVSTDTDVQQFLTTTNPSSFAQPDYNFVVGSQCTTGLTPIASVAAQQDETIPSAEYISGLIDFIDNANINDIIHDHLLIGSKAAFDKATKENPNSKNDAINEIANTYAEAAFGDAGIGDTVCNATCAGLPLGEQMQCQKGCAQSCISTCADTEKNSKASCKADYDAKNIECDQMSSAKKAICKTKAATAKTACDRQVDEDATLCVVDCTCFMVAGPQGEGRKMVEDMFNLKFCKVPVESKSTTMTTKNVGTIQEILESVVAALEALKRSGNMIKEVKTKEFLEFDIKLNLADIMDFKIFFAFKPIFAQKADAAVQRKKAIEATKSADALLGMAPDAESENYNKYVIISNVPANKASLEDVGVAAAQKQSLDNLTAVQDAAKGTLKNPISLYQNQKVALLGEDIISFLDSHQVFRNTFVTSLLSMLQDASDLKLNIQNSK